MPIRIFFLSWILFFPFSSKGQTASVSGSVVDEMGKPLVTAHVLIKNESRQYETFSDRKGNFSFSEIPCDTYSLIAFAYGKEIKQDTIAIQASLTLGTIVLSDLSGELDEVLIEAQREQRFGISHLQSVDNFGIYEGKKTEVILLKNINANLATNNPRQIYAKVAGLSIWESDGAGLQLGIGGRGLSPNRTANFNTRQNGYDISADALGYPESYYTPPTEALEKIEIVRGAASLQYGTQFLGMLNFRFKQGPKDKKLEWTSRQTVGSWGFFNSFNSLGGTLVKGKVNYYGYYQYKRGDGWRPNSGFDYHNAFASAHIALTPKFTLNVEGTYMHYLAQQAGGLTDKLFEDNPRLSLRERNWFQVDWNLWALNATYKFSAQTQLNVRNFGLWAGRTSLGNLERINVADFGGPRTMISGSFQNLGNESRLLHTYQLGEKAQTLLLGVRMYRGNTDASQGDADPGKGPDFRYLNPENLENSDYNFPNTNYALFAEHIFRPFAKFSITPGLRWESIQTAAKGFYKLLVRDGAGNIVSEQKLMDERERNRSFVLAGIGLSYKPKDSWEVYGNISQNYRAINFSDLRVSNPNLIVDPDIQDEEGFTIDLGLRGNRKEAFVYDFSLFYLFYKGRIGQILRADLPPLYIDYRFRSNISDARSFGIEGFGELDLARVWAFRDIKERWTLFTNISWVDARYIRTSDNSIRNNKVEMVPPLTVRFGSTWEKKHWKATIQYNYTAQHFSDATNAVRTSTAVEGIIPSYQVIDLSVSRSWKFLTLEAGCNNVLDEKYFTRRAESYPGPGIIPSDARGYYLTLQCRL